MSTRAVIIIEGNGTDQYGPGKPCCLYSHCDGYPDGPIGIIAQLAKAHATGQTPHPIGNTGSRYDRSWMLNRPGYVASMIILSEPGLIQFQPTTGPHEHTDVDWIYTVRPRCDAWRVEVRRPTEDYWDNPSRKNTRICHRFQPLDKLVERLVTPAAGAAG